MKLYTTEKFLPFNEIIEVRTSDGNIVHAESFDDGCAFICVEYVYVKNGNIVNDMFEWEGIRIINQYDYKNGAIYDLNNGHLAYDDGHKFMYFYSLDQLNDFLFVSNLKILKK